MIPVAEIKALQAAWHLRDDVIEKDDALGWSERIRCCSMADLFAEKLRALAERCHPRDLYDVVHIHRNSVHSGDWRLEVHASLTKKCAHARIQVPTRAALEPLGFVQTSNQSGKHAGSSALSTSLLR